MSVKNKKVDYALRFAGAILLVVTVVFYQDIDILVAIPTLSLSFILMLGLRSHEESRYNLQQREKVIKTASSGIKWTQSPILWMLILMVFGAVLTLVL